MPNPSNSQPRKPRRASPQKKRASASTDLRALNRKLKQEIAEREQADERLRILSQAIKQSQVTVMITDLESKIEYVNPKWVEITGYSVEEALGQNPRILKSGETSMEEYRQLWNTILSSRDWHGVFHNRKKNGELYWEEAIISPIMDADGQITHFVAVKEDITARKQTEKALQQRTHELGERVNELNCLYNLSTLVETSGESLEVLMQGVADLLPPAWQYPSITCARITLNGQTFSTANFEQTAWRQQRPIHVRGAQVGSVEVCYLEARPDSEEGPFLRQEGRLLEIVAERLGRATERIQTRQMLRESEEHLALATLASGQGVWDWNIIRDEAYLSPVYYELTGYIEGEIHPDSVFFASLIHPDDQPAVAKSMADHSQGQTEYSIIEYRMRRKSGEYRWIRGVGKVVERDDTGSPIRMAGVIHDITERKQAEAALLESEARFRSLYESSHDAILLTAPDGRIFAANEAACKLFEYTEAELIQLGRGAVVDRTDPRLAPALAERERTGRFRGELTMLKRGSQPFPVELSSNVFRDKDGQLRTSMIIRDITERKQAEEALRQHTLELDARNTELDTFGHTVAHDLKSPISAVIGFSEMLLDSRHALSEEDLHNSLQSLLSSGRKMNAIIEELMLLAGLREQEVVPKPIEMGQLIDETLDRLTLAIKESNADITHPDRSSWPIAIGYAPWIEEVWVNYVSNAIKYGGRPPHIELGATRQADSTVRFWVRDNGNGLTAEEQDRLFTPFTRLHQARAKGHGLGLSIVKRIIEKLGGTVGVESEIGAGSTFYFTLPAARS
jgi:PAS domain S-box-containing protein